MFSLISIGMVASGRTTQKLFLGAAALFAIGLAYRLGYMGRGPQGMWQNKEGRQRNQELLKLLEQLGQRVERAQQLTELEGMVSEFSASLGTVDLRLRVDHSSQTTPSGLTSYRILAPTGELGRIEAPMEEASINPNDRIMVQLLCDMLAPHLKRLRM